MRRLRWALVCALAVALSGTLAHHLHRRALKTRGPAQVANDSNSSEMAQLRAVFPKPASDPPRVPEAWLTYLQHDVLRNTVDFIHARGHRIAIAPVYSWDVPETRLETVVSRFFADSTEETFIRFQKDGKPYIRMLLPGLSGEESPETAQYRAELFQAFTRSFGSPEQRLWAVKVTSKNTHFVYGTDIDPFFIKIEDRWASVDGSIYLPRVINRPWDMQTAIRRGELVEAALRDKKSVVDSVLLEHFGANISFGGTRPLSYTIAFRTGQPILIQSDDDIAEEPLHGLLGATEPIRSVEDLDLVRQYASAAGLSVEDWLFQEEIPKFAEFVARENYEDGFFLEAHSQNVLARVNRRTGRIVGFDFRDMGDVVIDPMARLSKGLDPRMAWLPFKHGVMNGREFAVDVPQAQEAGKNIASFARLSLDAAFSYAQLPLRTRAVLTFLNAYRREAERVTGVTFELSPRIQRKMKLVDRFKGSQFLDFTDSLMKESAQEIYDQITRARVRALTLNAVAGDQGITREIFEIQKSEGQVAWLFPKAMKRYRNPFRPLLFQSTGNGILVSDARTQDPIAYAFQIKPSRQAIIEAANARIAAAPKTRESLILRCIRALRARVRPR